MDIERCPYCNQLLSQEGEARPGCESPTRQSTWIIHRECNLPAFSPHPEILDLSIEFGYAVIHNVHDLVSDGTWRGSLLANSRIPQLKKGRITRIIVTTGDSRCSGRIRIDDAGPKNGLINPDSPWMYHFTGIGKPRVTQKPPQEAAQGRTDDLRPADGS